MRSKDRAGIMISFTGINITGQTTILTHQQPNPSPSQKKSSIGIIVSKLIIMKRLKPRHPIIIEDDSVKTSHTSWLLH